MEGREVLQVLQVARGEELAVELGCQGMVMIAATTATARIAVKRGMRGWRSCR